jgi:hypothetical protein
MNKYLIILLSFLSSFNITAQTSSDEVTQYQSSLMSEYQSLLTKNNFNQTRINEIENIALENPYYDLRQWIALSYVTRSEVREVNSNSLKKSFNILHKSINENFFRSIPLAIYTTKYKELHEERKKLINTIDNKISLGFLNPVPLAELYILDGDYDSAFEALGPLKVKQLGVFFDKNTLEILDVQASSVVPFLQKGDKVLYINNELISINQVSKILSKYKTNTQQEITFKRNNELIKRKFSIPEERFNLGTAAHTMLFKSFSNRGFDEDDALAFLGNKDIQNEPSFLYYKKLVDSALCHHYVTDDETLNDERGLELCRSVADGYINQLESQQIPITDYEFYSEIGDRTQFQIYKGVIHHIISEANGMYYGGRLPQNKKVSIDLLGKYYPYFTDVWSSTYLWASKILTEEHISGKLLDRNPKKAFQYSKDFFGQDKRITKLLTGLVLDGEVDVDEVFLKNMLDDKYVQEFLVENDLYDYVVYKSFFDMKPFDKSNIDTCELASDNKLIKTNEITQIVYSICVTDDEIESPKYDIADFINTLSAEGISTGTYLIHQYNLDSSSYSSNYEKQLGILKLAKNQSKKNKKQKASESWLTGPPFLYFAFNDFIDEDIKKVSKQLQEEERFELALLKAEKQKEKEKLRKERAIVRREAAKKTGNMLGNLLEFTFKAALVVGAVALAGDVLEDSSPESIQAFSDSLSNSYQTYTYDWDGFYDAYNNWTYRCRTIENGRFAEDYHCIDKIRDDDRWPSY